MRLGHLPCISCMIVNDISVCCNIDHILQEFINMLKYEMQKLYEIFQMTILNDIHTSNKPFHE